MSAEHRRPEVYPLLPDYEGSDVNPAPDGRPWRKACKVCLFRRHDPQDLGDGFVDSVRHHQSGEETLFYCVHRLDGEHNRVCACYAACRSPLPQPHPERNA